MSLCIEAVESSWREAEKGDVKKGYGVTQEERLSENERRKDDGKLLQ